MSKTPPRRPSAKKTVRKLAVPPASRTVSVARAAEVADDHEGRISALLKCQMRGSVAAGECSWRLVSFKNANQERRAAVAWIIADTIIKTRCGPSPAYQLWRDAALAGQALTGRDRVICWPFLDLYGDPDNPPTATDHLEGHVNEWLWYLLTRELDNRHIVVVEGPSFYVTDSGGDGFVIYRSQDAELMFRLWELKKHLSASPVSKTVNRAYKQLFDRGDKYLAQLTAVLADESEEVRDFCALLVELWVDADERAGLGVGVTSSSGRPIEPFNKMAKKFPSFAAAGQLEGLFCALDDYRGLAREVRRMVWNAL
jgi:hypothetical protein